MAAISETAFQCANCTNWFPSGIQFNDDRLFDAAHLWGNRVQCPFCGQLVPLGKANMRWRYADGQYGGFSGDDTKGPSPEKTPAPVVARTGEFADETFRGQTFLLDKSSFSNCTFIGCTLQYSGEGPGGRLDNCTLTQSMQPFRLVGPAAGAMQFLADLYRSGGAAWVEQTFSQIRGDQPNP